MLATSSTVAARRMIEEPDEKYRGIFHLTGAGHASWAEFAQEILFLAEAQQGNEGGHHDDAAPHAAEGAEQAGGEADEESGEDEFHERL